MPRPRTTESRYLIYGLIDPRDRMIHYVGLSSSGLQRPRKHDKEHEIYGNSPKVEWIRDLLSCGLTYEIVVLEYVRSSTAPADFVCWWNEGRNPRCLPEAERWWIAYGRASGWPLTNSNEGGDGNLGYSPPEDVCRRISDTQRRLVEEGRHHFQDPDFIEALRIAMKGDRNQMKDPDVARRSGESRRGMRQTDEARRHGSEAATRRWTTPEMIDFMKGPNNPARKPGAREKIRAAALKRNRPRQPCGTVSAYSHAIRMRAQGLPNCGPCAACKRASADYALERKRRKAEREKNGG